MNTPTARRRLPPMSPEESLARRRFCMDYLMPLLSPGRRWPEPVIRRELASLVRGALRAVPLEDLLLACRELRRQADGGDLAPWIRPGQPFTLGALLYQGSGPRNLERFLHDGRKRQEAGDVAARRQARPQSLAALVPGLRL